MVEPHARIILSTTRAVLRELGLTQRGRSGRHWYDDHGWWLINVEFQPSGFGKGSYANVGYQHLFRSKDYIFFEQPARVGTYVAFEGDEAAFTRAFEVLVDEVVSEVERRRFEHRVGDEALRLLCSGDDNLVGGVAHALRGDQQRARTRLTGRVHEAWRSTADAYLAALTQGTARDLATSSVDQARSQLNLAYRDWTWNE